MEELDGTEKNTLKVFKAVTLIHQVGMVLLEVSAQVWLRSAAPHFTCMFLESACSQQKSPFVSRLHPSLRFVNSLLLPAFSVDCQPSQRHVRRCHHHRGAGGAVKPQSAERSVSARAPVWFHYNSICSSDFLMNLILKKSWRHRMPSWTSLFSKREWESCYSMYSKCSAHLNAVSQRV